QGDLGTAAGYLREGLELATEAGDETSTAYYLEGLAAIAGEQADPQRAVRLRAAAGSLLESRGSGWLHAWVRRSTWDDAVLATSRCGLTVAEFEEAQKWGAFAGSSQAVQYA